MTAFDRLREGATRVVNLPVGVIGRYRPFYFMNVLDRLQGRTLEAAVRDKVVMVTGASSGIGHDTALRLGRSGATVVLVARSADRLAEVKAGVEAGGGTAFVYPADLADLDDIERLAGEVLAAHGRVDVLINNAGRSIRRSVHLSYDRFHDFQRTMQLNYFGAVRLILAVLPGMRERGEGHIVNVSSAGVQAGAPRFAGYIASKAALDAFSESVQAEVHADGVRFTTIYMPLVRTPMITPTKLYERLPAITPDKAAELVCDAVTYRPRRIGTLVGTAAALGSAVAPWTMDAVRGWAYQLFPDSPAARGEVGGVDQADDEQVSVLGTVFGRVTRGIHW